MRKAFAVIVMISLSNFAFGQGITTKFGIKAGVNIAHLKMTAGGLSATSGDLIALHAGFYAVLMTSEKFGLQPELIYSAQGGNDSGGSGDFNINYLNVPFMFRYDVSPGVNIHAGPQLGFLLSATIDGLNAKEALNSVDFGLGFGLGVERPSGFSFGFRYNLGLSNTFSTAATSAFAGLGLGSLTMVNQVMQLSIGHTF